MARTDDDLALRKELLVARSTLLRLKLRHEGQSLRHAFTWRGAGGAVLGSPTGRQVLFLLAAETLGRSRMAILLAQAVRALAIAKLTVLAVQALRKPPESGPS